MSVRIKLAIAGLLLLVVAGFAKRWSSNSIDLEPVADAPVKVINISMRHALAAGLGAGGVTLTSGTPANAIGVHYETKATDRAEEHFAVDARRVCRVGDHTIATPLTHDASNRQHAATLGSLVSGSTTLLPSAFQDEIPTVCEAEFFYAVQPPIDVETGKAEGAKRVPLGRVCLAEQTVRPGPCSDAELARPAPSGKLSVSDRHGSIGALGKSGKYGLRIASLITAGADAPERWQVGATARCTTSAGGQEVPIPLLVLGLGLRPGESIRGGSALGAHSGLSSKPEHCTITSIGRAGDQHEALESYCVRDRTVDAGACSARSITPSSRRRSRTAAAHVRSPSSQARAARRVGAAPPPR